MVEVDAPIWVIDVEGSGSMPPEIIELAMVEVRDFELTGVMRHWLIRPRGTISPMATRIHGLTEADLVDAPFFDDIVDDVLLWIEGRPLVGHNVKVDVDALKGALPGWLPVYAFDTLKMARMLRPGQESYSLSNLGRQFGLSNEAASRTGANAHAALFDATLAALLFIDLLKCADPADREAALRHSDIVTPRQGSLF